MVFTTARSSSRDEGEGPQLFFCIQNIHISVTERQESMHMMECNLSPLRQKHPVVNELLSHVSHSMCQSGHCSALFHSGLTQQCFHVPYQNVVVDLNCAALEAQAAHHELIDTKLTVAIDVQELEEGYSIGELQTYQGKHHLHLVALHVLDEVLQAHGATRIWRHLLEDAGQPLQHLLRLLKLPLHSQINVHVRALHGVIDEDRIDHVQDGQDRDDNKKNEDQGILH